MNNKVKAALLRKVLRVTNNGNASLVEPSKSIRDRVEDEIRKNPLIYWVSIFLFGATSTIGVATSLGGILGFKLMTPKEIQSLSPEAEFEATGTAGVSIPVGGYAVTSLLTVSATAKAEPHKPIPRKCRFPNDIQATDDYCYETPHPTKKPTLYVYINQDKLQCGARSEAYATPATAELPLSASTICSIVLPAKHTTLISLVTGNTLADASSTVLKVRRRTCLDCVDSKNGSNM